MTLLNALRGALLCSSALVVAAPATGQATQGTANPQPAIATTGQTTPGNSAQTVPAAEPDSIAGSPVTQSAPDQPRTGGLTDVIVTARRRVENVQNVPVAAQVVSDRQVQALNITSIEKLAILAPQLIVGRNGSGNGASIGLRGITVNSTSISLEQSVATVIDGVYYSGGRALNLGLFDVAQIEILKGPQSLFYGKNTTAGAVSITTADPLDHFATSGKIGYEFNAEQPYFQAAVTGPISDTLSLRLAGGYSRQIGSLIRNLSQAGIAYTRDVATGTITRYARPAGDPDLSEERNGYIRGSAKWQPIEGLTAIVKATYNDYHLNTPNSAAVISNCESGSVQSDPLAPCGHRFALVQSAMVPQIAATNRVANRHGGQTYLDYYAFNATGNITYDAGKLSFSFVPAYTAQTDYWLGDFDFTDNYLGGPNPPGTAGTGGNHGATREGSRITSVEARAQSRFDGMLNFMVGGFFQSSRTFFSIDRFNPGGSENSAVSDPSLRFVSIRDRSFTNGKTYSAFGQLLVDITPELNITGGVRYTRETKDSVLDQSYVNPALLASFVVRRNAADQTFNNTSPEATITYKPLANVTIYGSYRTGYKSGGFSISGQIAPTSTPLDAAFGPERVKGFEGGIKTTLLDNQLRLNADAFTYRYRGLQVDYFDPLTIQYFTQNVGSARTRGVEAEAELAPRGIDGLNLRAAVAYTKARYIDFRGAPCVGGQTPAEGCSLNINPITGAATRQDLSGQTTPQAPEWAGTVGGDFERPVSGALKAGMSVNVRFSSRYKTYGFATDAAKRFYQSGYAAIDASLNLGQNSDRWRVQLVGKNLTNQFIMNAAYDLTYTGARAGLATGLHSDTRASVADPRTIALELLTKF